MRRKRIVQAGKCYHLVSRVAHKAAISARIGEIDGAAASGGIVDWLFGMFGSGKGKKAEREKEMQKAPSELAEKYPMPPKYELALEEGNGETAKRLLALSLRLASTSGRGGRIGDEGLARTRGGYVADQGARAAKMKSAPGPGTTDLGYSTTPHPTKGVCPLGFHFSVRPY